MGTWMLRWNFNAASYRPGDKAYVSFWLDNTGVTPLYMGNVQVNFDFGSYNLQTIAGQVNPMSTKLLGTEDLPLPLGQVGRKTFSISYNIHEYVADRWVDLGLQPPDRQYFISVYPGPFYRVFVSRGIGLEDRAVNDPIVEIIKEWGFETVTVGVEVQAADEKVPRAVRDHITKADAVIAIATRRSLDAMTGLWRTLEWVHAEIGVGFGIDKPLLILKDQTVTLGGLPSYLESLQQAPVVEFEAFRPEELRSRLAAVMPGFRAWLETKRRQEFWSSLRGATIGGLAVVGGAIILGGALGALSGSSKK